MACLVAIAGHRCRHALGAGVRPQASDVYGRAVRSSFSLSRIHLPPFTAKDIDGREISTATWRGKVAILNFWATWCPPCRKEIPALAALQEKYQARISSSSACFRTACRSTSCARSTAACEVNYPIVQTTADIDAVTGQVLALPTTWLIDRAGRVVSTHVGEIDPGAASNARSRR